MKIVLDCYGGDNSPKAHVKGAVDALKENKELKVTLVGKSQEIEKELSLYDFDETRLDVLNAEEVITCEEVPTSAIRTKKNSSLCVALDLLKHDEDYGCLISSGSTGAILAGGIMKIGRIKGISRPALAPLLPTQTSSMVMLIDSGANVDCKPENLYQFALMGSVYFREYFGIEKPKVAILSNGTEDEKGCQLSKAAFELIKDMPNIDFCGNMEARDILSGEYHVVVCDGFYGNIALKSLEGAVKMCLKSLKQEIKKSFFAKFGALFMKGAFSKLKTKMDYNAVGGAVFLGVEKPIIKAHGSSNDLTIKNALLQAYAVAKSGIGEKIKNGLKIENDTENL